MTAACPIAWKTCKNSVRVMQDDIPPPGPSLLEPAYRKMLLANKSLQAARFSWTTESS